MQYLAEAGLTVQLIEQHDEALSDMVRDIQGKLLSTELPVKLQRLHLPVEIDFEQAKLMAKVAATAIKAQKFGYEVTALV